MEYEDFQEELREHCTDGHVWSALSHQYQGECERRAEQDAQSQERYKEAPQMLERISRITGKSQRDILRDITWQMHQRPRISFMDALTIIDHYFVAEILHEKKEAK